MPGGTFAKRYLPVSFVVVFRESFVDGSTSVTPAPATAAPEGSVTVPATVPVEAAWASNADGVKANRQHRATTNKTTRLLNIQLPPGAGLEREATDLQNSHARKIIFAETFGTPHAIKPTDRTADEMQLASA